jgi:hypothetical protein
MPRAAVGVRRFTEPRHSAKYARPVRAVVLAAVALTACTHLPRSTEPCELGADVTAGRPESAAEAVVVAVRKKAWEAALGGEARARPHVRARLAGWPRTLSVSAETLPTADRDFVVRLARDTWRGLEAFTDREHRLPVDHVHLKPTPDDSRVGDYTNVTTVGLRLVAIVAAHDLGFVDADEATREIAAILDTLDRLETHAGFFFNYYDTTSLERTSNLVSFVDSSWLTAGLIVVRNALPALAARASAIVERQDYRLFYDPGLGRMTHGWWVHRHAPSRYHYGVLYAESRLGSLIAIGKGDVPPSHWFRMVRTFSPACAWQTQTPHGRRTKEVDGQRFAGGWYEWRGTRYVPSWGGSMFEALMPTLVLDEARFAPESLGANDAAHVAVQRRFATDELGYPVWGLSPSTLPTGDGYGEFGARPLGIVGYGAGAVTPHAAALALPIDPDEAVKDLKLLAPRYGAYGDFGLYDAVDARSGAVARTYLTLDQEMLFIAAANWLTQGRVQAYFAADPIVQRALPVLARERFFEG